MINEYSCLGIITTKIFSSLRSPEYSSLSPGDGLSSPREVTADLEFSAELELEYSGGLGCQRRTPPPPYPGLGASLDTPTDSGVFSQGYTDLNNYGPPDTGAEFLAPWPIVAATETDSVSHCDPVYQDATCVSGMSAGPGDHDQSHSLVSSTITSQVRHKYLTLSFIFNPNTQFEIQKHFRANRE